MIKLVKLGLWGIFINYYPFHIMFGHFIPYGTYIFFAITMFGVVGDIVVDCGGDLYIDKPIKTWIIYALLSVITSVFAINTGYALTSLIDFGIKICIIFAVAYVCERENSVMFAVRLLAGIAVLSAGTAFLQMGNINQRLELDSGAAISVNDFGSLMAYGCFAVIPLFKYSGIRSKLMIDVLIVSGTILLLIELFISGSRKSFYAVILLYALYFIFITLRNGNRIKATSILRVLVLVIEIYFIYKIFLQQYIPETSLYARLFGDKADAAASSDESRIRLYFLALDNFLEHPFVGMGFNNFRYKYGVYTHSTYAEPIACGGLIGVLYLIPIFRILKNQVHLAFNRFQDNVARIWNTELLIFYIVFLFVGIGIPFQYKEIPCIVFGMMIASQNISS